MTFDSWLAIALQLIGIPIALVVTRNQDRIFSSWDRFFQLRRDVNHAQTIAQFRRVKHYYERPDQLNSYLMSVQLRGLELGFVSVVLGMVMFGLYSTSYNLAFATPGVSADVRGSGVQSIFIAMGGIVFTTVLISLTVSTISDGRILAQRCAAFAKYRRLVAARVGEEKLAAAESDGATLEEDIAVN